MAGNSFGTLFRVTTFGESHGEAVGAVIDGVPSRLKLSIQDIQKQLNRRRPGQNRVATPRKEPDQVNILSGLFEGKTTGAPIALVIRNTNANPKDYTNLKDLYRPGHADHTFDQKFGIRDWRGSGRASGRETAARVAAGAVALKYLKSKAITVQAYTKSIASIEAKKIDLSQIEKNIVRCPDSQQAKKMIQAIEKAKARKDSLGGVVEAIVHGCPSGLGDPVFDKLDARLAQAIMSIGAVKAFEIGDGFSITKLYGSQANDSLIKRGKKIRSATNHAGGIVGGISTGDDIVLRAAIKPTSSIGQKQKTINVKGKAKNVAIEGRHDPCICPRAVVVVEAMIALVLADCMLIQKSIR